MSRGVSAGHELCLTGTLFYLPSADKLRAYYHQQAWRLTLQVTDVLRLRIRACVARPATAKCGGKKPHKGT